MAVAATRCGKSWEQTHLLGTGCRLERAQRNPKIGPLTLEQHQSSRAKKKDEKPWKMVQDKMVQDGSFFFQPALCTSSASSFLQACRPVASDLWHNAWHCRPMVSAGHGEFPGVNGPAASRPGGGLFVGWHFKFETMVDEVDSVIV